MSSISPDWSSKSPKSLMGFWSRGEVSWLRHQLLGSVRQFHYLCDSILAGAAKAWATFIQIEIPGLNPCAWFRRFHFFVCFQVNWVPASQEELCAVNLLMAEVIKCWQWQYLGWWDTGRYCGNIKFLLEFMQWISSLDLNWNRVFSST